LDPAEPKRVSRVRNTINVQEGGLAGRVHRASDAENGTDETGSAPILGPPAGGGRRTPDSEANPRACSDGVAGTPSGRRDVTPPADCSDDGGRRQEASQRFPQPSLRRDGLSPPKQALHALHERGELDQVQRGRRGHEVVIAWGSPKGDIFAQHPTRIEKSLLDGLSTGTARRRAVRAGPRNRLGGMPLGSPPPKGVSPHPREVEGMSTLELSTEELLRDVGPRSGTRHESGCRGA
jgi:hypothetical protein